MSESHSPNDSPPKYTLPHHPSSSNLTTVTVPEGSPVLKTRETLAIIPCQESCVASLPTEKPTSLLSNTAATVSHNPSEKPDHFGGEDEFVFEDSDTYELLNQRPEPKKRRLGRCHKATRKSINIIDQIWNLCATDVSGAEVGQEQTDKTQSKETHRLGTVSTTEYIKPTINSYPVYRLRSGLYLVAASLSDYRVFKRLQVRTSAKRTITSFKSSTTLPGHYQPSSYIRVDMASPAHDHLATLVEKFLFALTKQEWKHNGEEIVFFGTGGGKIELRWHNKLLRQHPDASLSTLDFGPNRPPFLIMEVAVTRDATQQLKNWVGGGRGYIKLVVHVQLLAAPIPEQYRVTLSIIRPTAVPAGIPNRPQALRLRAQYLIRDLEIFPQKAQETFEISFTDILGPKDFIDTSQNTSVARVNLGHPFWTIAKRAVQLKLNEGSPSSPPDLNQVDSSGNSSASSNISEDWWDGDDEAADPNYEE